VEDKFNFIIDENDGIDFSKIEKYNVPHKEIKEELPVIELIEEIIIDYGDNNE